MSNEFESISDSPDQPARNVSAVTPDDVIPLANVSKALYIGTAGTVVLRAVDDSADATFVGLQAGQTLPVRASHVRATGTTAGNINNLY